MTNTLAKNTRKQFRKTGNLFRSDMTAVAISTQDFTLSVAGVLRRAYGDTRSAVKNVAAIAGSNLRTAENWLTGKNAPQGPYLMALMADCDELTHEILRLARRDDLADTQKRAAAVSKIEAALKEMNG